MAHFGEVEDEFGGSGGYSSPCLAPFAVEVGRWGGHGAAVLLLAMVPRL